MSGKKQLSKNVLDVWHKLSKTWIGDASKAFYDGYIVKMMDIADSFDDASLELNKVSSDFLKELKRIEQTISNQ